MLIPFPFVLQHCPKQIKGIIHIGAHDCEEQEFYNRAGIFKDKVIWIEAMEDKVDKFKKLEYNIHNLVVSDTDGDIVRFNITNNGQSSSIFELGTHLQHHPSVHVLKTIYKTTTRMDSFIKQQNIDMTEYNFINLDIQGAELKALKGFSNYLKHIDYIYTEVNTEHVYKDCALMSELDAYLKQFGFVRKLTKMTQFNWGDALYVKS